MYTYLAGVMSLVVAGQFIYSPVFADGPVDISIVEKVDDGAGGYKDWEDIAGAMPGMTYSAIPRIINNGAIAVPVTFCLTESGENAAGDVIQLDAGTFQIDINDAYWSKLDGVGSSTIASPISVCYRYNSELAAGEITEPLFSEVHLSEQLGNVHKNATFALHLDAYAEDGILPEPTRPDEPVAPGEPNTGKYTNSEPLTTAGYVTLSAGLVALVGMITHLIVKAIRRK